MAAKINAKSKLYIALDPTAATEAEMNYTLICFNDEVLFTTSMNKVDKKYFCNGGATTSIVTGYSHELAVSIDYINSNPAHKYLLSLLNNVDFSKVNNQYFKIEYPLFEGEYTPLNYSGKSCIQFKNNIPSGAADELVKLTFSIFPQDDPWKITPATLTPIPPTTPILMDEKNE